MTDEERAHQVIRQLNEAGIVPSSLLRPILVENFSTIRAEAMAEQREKDEKRARNQAKEYGRHGFGIAARGACFDCAAAIRDQD